MGIQGLLRNLQPLLVSSSDNDDTSDTNATNQKTRKKKQSTNNIRQFANHALAIDASSWLYKAGYSIADTLVEALEQASEDQLPAYWQRSHPHIARALTNYMVKRCTELFQYANIAQITLVFDGKVRCPLKQDTNADRSSKRAANLARARLLRSQGRMAEASELYRTCVKVSFSLSMVVRQMILRQNHPRVSCIVAPYEADAQLAKLCLAEICHAVVTEDSDLLVYSAAIGVAFPIIFKLDRNTGSCVVMSMSWLFSPASSTEQTTQKYGQVKNYASNADKENKFPNPSSLPGSHLTLKKGSKLAQYLQSFQLKEKSSPGLGKRLFVEACVLAGCDYTTNTLSLDGIGLITSCKSIAAHAHRSHNERLQHVLRDWKGSGGGATAPSSVSASNKVSLAEYEELLAKSVAVFYYHYVYCSSNNNIVPLQPLHGTFFSSTSSDENESICISSGNGITVKKEDNEHMPNLNRFQEFHSFLGTDNSVDYDYSHNAAVGAMYSYTANGNSTPRTSNNSHGWISTKEHKQTGRQTSASSIFHQKRQFGGDILEEFQASKCAPTKISPMSTQLTKTHPLPFSQKQQVKSKEEACDDDGEINSLFSMLKDNVVSASTTQMDASASSTYFQAKRKSSGSSAYASTKVITSTSAEQAAHPFATFAHGPREYSLPSPLQPENERIATDCTLARAVSTPEEKCNEDDESVPSSLPPKLYESNVRLHSGMSTRDAASRVCGNSSLDQFLDSLFPNGDRKEDEEQEVPSSYRTELEKSSVFPAAFATRRVSTRSPRTDNDSIESISPFSTKKRSRSLISVNNRNNSMGTTTTAKYWTDDDSDCCILVHENRRESSTNLSTKEKKTAAWESVERNRSSENCVILEEITSPQPKLTSHFHNINLEPGRADPFKSHFGEAGRTTSKKKAKAASNNRCKPSNTIMAGFARQQEIYGSRMGTNFSGSSSGWVTRDNFLGSQQRVSTKATGGTRPDRRNTLHNFVQPLLTTKRNIADF